MSEECERWVALADEQLVWERENPDRPWAGPMAQALADQQIDAERERFEAGDKMALLAAIAQCAHHERPIPDWAAVAFLHAYRSVIHCRERSWDAVFGKPYPGKHVASLRRRVELRPQVWLRVREVRATHPDLAIGPELFELVGDELGIGKTLCEEIYYEGKKVFSPSAP